MFNCTLLRLTQKRLIAMQMQYKILPQQILNPVLNENSLGEVEVG